MRLTYTSENRRDAGAAFNAAFERNFVPTAVQQTGRVYATSVTLTNPLKIAAAKQIGFQPESETK